MNSPSRGGDGDAYFLYKKCNQKKMVRETDEKTLNHEYEWKIRSVHNLTKTLKPKKLLFSKSDKKDLEI